jgi:hypothetical protein
MSLKHGKAMNRFFGDAFHDLRSECFIFFAFLPQVGSIKENRSGWFYRLGNHLSLKKITPKLIELAGVNTPYRLSVFRRTMTP